MNYYLRRALRVPLTVIAVATLTFGMIRLLPGGPFTQLRIQLIRQGMPVEQVNARIAALQNIRPDAPLWRQYLDYMIGVFQLDLGQSISLNQPVIEVIDLNYLNRGELLMVHRHEGIDLKLDWAQATMEALHHIWTRPVLVRTVVGEKHTILRYDGQEHTAETVSASE